MRRRGPVLTFHLESSILVRRPLAEIPRFFADPRSLSAWDKSVARVEPMTDGPLRVGYTFTTIGPARPGREGKRSAYRVTRLEPAMNQVELTDSKVFQKAVWTFTFSPATDGTLTTCAVDVVVRLRYFVVALLLRLNRRALQADLQQLKAAIEGRPAAAADDRGSENG